MSYTVVIPTIGRPSLGVLLAQLVSGDASDDSHGHLPAVVVVDDRSAPAGPLAVDPPVRVLRSGGRGPAAAEALAADAIVAWFQGRSEFGPRALGHRSLLAHPGRAGNLDRLNAVKGREQFRPVAPMVLADRAAELFGRGPVPSPYMLFVHDVAPQWRDRIPAVVHVDGTARIQTVDRGSEPLLARLLDRFAELTGLPAVVNTSLNTAGRPMVDDPRDALECFGSAPVDVLVLGPFLLRRCELTR